jgi:hypothetical protein
VYARSPLLLRNGEADFVEAEFNVRFNAVGSWELKLDGRSTLIDQLLSPGWGIEVVNDDGITVLSGPVDERRREFDASRNLVTLYGSDDNTHLAERLANPEPATALPPYSTNAYDVRSGTCSTVLRAYVNANLGAGALGPRRVTGMGLQADPLVGSSVTGRARWQVLLELLQELAQKGGGLGFRVRQVGAALQFQVYQPVDRSGTVQFSVDKGNLASYTYRAARSSVNYAYVGGGGEGTARTVREAQDSTEIAVWRRIERFVDRRDTTDTTELDQEAAKTLTEGKGETSVSVVPVDLPGSAYLTDYDLGDRVSAVVDDTITDVIREVKITLTPDGPQKVQPSIGTPGYQDVLKLFRSLQKINTRVTNLERR